MTRTVTAQQSGPITLDVGTTAGDIEVIAEDRASAEITITGAEDVVTSEQGDTIKIRVVEPHVTITQAGRGVTVSHGGIVVTGSGSVVIGNGNVQYNTFGGGGTSHVVGSGMPVKVVARVPSGSSLHASTASGDVETSGELRAVRATSKSGDVEIGQAGSVDAKTMSGDIIVADLGGDCRANSMSGSVTIHAIASGTIHADTMSGNVRVTRAAGVVGTVEARSMSGRTRVS